MSSVVRVPDVQGASVLKQPSKTLVLGTVSSSSSELVTFSGPRISRACVAVSILHNTAPHPYKVRRLGLSLRSMVTHVTFF